MIIKTRFAKIISFIYLFSKKILFCWALKDTTQGESAAIYVADHLIEDGAQILMISFREKIKADMSYL
jgi:UDPglucose 6-dehydrogenase